MKDDVVSFRIGCFPHVSMKCGEAGVPQLKSAGCDYDQPESVNAVASRPGRQVKTRSFATMIA